MKLNRWGKTIAICVAIFAVLAGIKFFQIRSAIAFAESFPEHSESVESALVTISPYVETLVVLGEVLAPQQVALYSETSGRITQVGFASGATVGEGQVLIQLDVSEEQAQLQAAEASLDLAESIYRRNKNLFQSNAVSEEAYDRARVELAKVKAEIARLASIIRKKTIKAPFSGKTGIHQFEPGLVLQGNEFITQLVADKKYLWVDFHVPQFYPLLENGAKVEVQLLRNNKEDNWARAEIIARNTEVDPTNRSFKYRAKVNVNDLPAGIGSGVSVRLAVASPQQVATVPATAIQQDQLGMFVFLLQPEEGTQSFRAKRQDVEVINRDAELAYVSKGLAAKQLVAADGAFKLYPGLLVHSKLTVQRAEANVAMAEEGESEPVQLNSAESKPVEAKAVREITP